MGSKEELTPCHIILEPVVLSSVHSSHGTPSYPGLTCPGPCHGWDHDNHAHGMNDKCSKSKGQDPRPSHANDER